MRFRAALPDDAHAAARERLGAAGVDLGRLDEAVQAFAFEDAGDAGPTLSESFGPIDPKPHEDDRTAEERAMNDVGSVFNEPSRAVLTVAYKDPARKARVRQALRKVLVTWN